MAVEDVVEAAGHVAAQAQRITPSSTRYTTSFVLTASQLPLLSMRPLPAEVLGGIADHLDRRDVFNLLLVNQEVNRAVTARVRTKLEVRFINGDIVTTAHGKNVPPLHRNWLPNMVQSLDLYSERGNECAVDIQSLLTPSEIRLVRIFPDASMPPESPAWDAEGNNSSAVTDGAQGCSTLTGLQPRTLVVRGAVGNWRVGLNCLKPYILERVKHMVAVFSASPTTNRTTSIWFNRATLPAAEEITVVFPSLPGAYWRPTITIDGLAPFPWLERQLRLLTTTVIDFASDTMPFRLNIVNAGSIDPECLDYGFDHESAAAGREDRQAHVEHLLWSFSSSVIPPHMVSEEKRRFAVRFSSMEKWIAEGRAEGILDEAEIRPWVE